MSNVKESIGTGEGTVSFTTKWETSMSMQLYGALRDAGFAEEQALRLAKAVVVYIELRCSEHEQCLVSRSTPALLRKPGALHTRLLTQTDLTKQLVGMKRQLVGWVVFCNAVLATLVYIIARTTN